MCKNVFHCSSNFELRLVVSHILYLRCNFHCMNCIASGLLLFKNFVLVIEEMRSKSLMNKGPIVKTLSASEKPKLRERAKSDKRTLSESIA